jgi:hypothetical protein
MHSLAKSSLTATCFQIIFYCHCVHLHIFCWIIYRRYQQIDSVLSLQTKCSTEEFHLEGTEDCWSPPCLLQFVVACDWGSHSFHPDASSFCYCSVHADINQKGWFLLECKVTWALWQRVASSQVLWSPTSLALNADHLANRKAWKYTLSSIQH